ncbi:MULTISPECIES: ABC transporter substrate-binding protein [Methanothrix]|jgi:ABC-type dipeptide transport system, periplasmic component|nr:ABC transporter substrate-binding protein [Methanothrix sp.]HOE46818.1 ABC transporter substrate-binding protein [Methanothrix soehngenii]MBP7068923.1 ABC transporter substrate-binding protein [Methanothrix sp.]HOS23077.1 ABC transporter substrate-binding protein [Methanothrix soehngenii]HPL21303.1 ABC transporter substrate-binding protein [Methanothrix soehngenii]HRW32932.1 ABC transporter substrate-binding protein [Methanothrix sp.]
MRVPLTLGFAVMGLLVFILSSNVLAADEKVDTLTVAALSGDQGFPSPYGHYPHGGGYIMMSFIFDTLIWKDQNGFVPALAETWKYLPDENAYLFHLRKGVTWNDGEPFTADDVAFTFQYTKDHPYPLVDSSIIDKAEAIDENTVKIVLTKSYAPFLDQVAGAQPILPLHIYRNMSDPDDYKDEKALTGTGPFRLVDYDQTQGTYFYKANEDYYQGSPRVKQLKFVKVSNEMASASLKKGDIDAASVPAETTEPLEKEGFDIKESHDTTMIMAINHKKEPFSDVRFRKAIYYAIDRQALVDIFLRGFGCAGCPGILPSDHPWYNPDQEQYSFDPAKAEELLKEMGYSKDGQYFSKDGERLEIELLVAPTEERLGELIEHQLESGGITVNLRSMDLKTKDSMVDDWKFDLAINYHGGMGADPSVLNRIIIGTGLYSSRYAEDVQLVDLLNEQVSEMDPARRKELVSQAQEIIACDLPSLPLFYIDSFWASDDRVSFYYTYGGVAMGTPTALNKMAFV